MTNPDSTFPPDSLPARLWKAALGLSLIVFGSFFCWWLFATWRKASLMDHWERVDALILSSEIAPWRYNEFSRMEFEPRVRYRYEFAGTSRESSRIRRVPIRSAFEAKVRAWTDRFPAGETVPAWVDPAEPENAVLRRDSKAALYSIWFPAIFVVGGAGLVWTAARPRPAVSRGGRGPWTR